jgi:hypothetical protein
VLKGLFDVTFTPQHHSYHGELKHARRAVEDEEALCAVCGDGSAAEGNEIVFCERCDLAVHQDCYGLAHIPEGVGGGVCGCVWEGELALVHTRLHINHICYLQ